MVAIPTFGIASAITYNLNGGTNNPANTATYTHGIGLTLNNPTQPGYAFDGWYADASFTGTPILAIPATSISDVTLHAKWSACVAPTTGDGTSTNPYQIATLGNLYWLSQTNSVWDKSFIQIADIYATTTSSWNNGSGFSPIGNSTSNFTGTYNGQWHTIIGLTINRSSTDIVGFFGSLGTNGTVKNIGLIASSIKGNSYVGGVVGVNNGILAYCYNTGTISGSIGNVGGVVGNNSSGTITNCYNTGVVSGTEWGIGGVAGNNMGITSNCYNTGTVNGINGDVGGVAGYNQSSGTITNCYNTGAVSGTNHGGVVGYNVGILNYCYCNTDVYATGVGYNSGTDNCVGKTTAQMQSADFVTLLNANKGSYSSWVLVSGGYPTFGYVITYNLNGGTNNSANPAIHAYGVELTLSNPTKTFNIFGGWFDNAGFTGTAITAISATATSDVTLYAKWSEILYTIIGIAGANGSISPSGAVSVKEGNDQSFTITANSGYHIIDVLVDGSSVGAVSSYNL